MPIPDRSRALTLVLGAHRFDDDLDGQNAGPLTWCTCITRLGNKCWPPSTGALDQRKPEGVIHLIATHECERIDWERFEPGVFREKS